MPPKMAWNADTDAKLLHGILVQIQDTSVKLDYEALAKYMGPEYIASQIKGRLGRIRGHAKVDVESSPAGSAPGTPTSASPEKRKRTPAPRAPRSKKPKKEQKGVNEEKAKKKGKAQKELQREEVTDGEQKSTDLKDLADVLEQCEDKGKTEDSAMNESEEEREVMDELDEDS